MNLFKKNSSERSKKIVSKMEKIRIAQSNNIAMINNIATKASVIFQNNDKFQDSYKNLIEASKRYNRALAFFHFNLIKAIHKNSKKNH